MLLMELKQLGYTFYQVMTWMQVEMHLKTHICTNVSSIILFLSLEQHHIHAHNLQLTGTQNKHFFQDQLASICRMFILSWANFSQLGLMGSILFLCGQRVHRLAVSLRHCVSSFNLHPDAFHALGLGVSSFQSFPQSTILSGFFGIWTSHWSAKLTLFLQLGLKTMYYTEAELKEVCNAVSFCAISCGKLNKKHINVKYCSTVTINHQTTTLTLLGPRGKTFPGLYK